jgi:HSP20 family protein
LANRLNRAFDLHLRDDDRESMSLWNPAVDIFEEKDDVVIKAELPGMNKDDIDLRVENNVLTLTGQRKREKEVNEDGYFRSERAYGTFSRSFTLPTTVDVGKIAASYKDGVLTINLPKAEEAKPKQIDVKVA